METKRVYENTAHKIVAYSDNGAYRLIAQRRAISEQVNGVMRYYGSKWYIETHQRKGYGFAPVVFQGLDYVFKKKEDIIKALSKSIQFKQAYSELK